MSWKPLFDQFPDDFDLDSLYNERRVTYPPKELVFRPFEINMNDIKVVLLGQDPYDSPGQAHGLSFSVPTYCKIPSSLRNIYKELQLEFPDRNYEFQSGNLEKWFSNENIFLLNSALTVAQNNPGSDLRFWEDFINNTIKFISENNERCVFILLGNYAKSKSAIIKNKSKVILAPHPLAYIHDANTGFIGSNVFKKAEEILGERINWTV